MSTRVKQRAVMEFLTAEKVTPTEIHRRLKAVYGDDAVDRSQKRIANHIGISKERVGFIIEQLGYRKICA
jgi:hypothetical protein